jgi:glycosyltransferase involved in cell wall biosynthesis
VGWPQRRRGKPRDRDRDRQRGPDADRRSGVKGRPDDHRVSGKSSRAPEGVLVFFHCQSNAGYAIRTLEEVLLSVAENVAGPGRVYFAYRQLDDVPPAFLPPRYHQHVFQLDPPRLDETGASRIQTCLAERNITLAIGFDQPVASPGHRVLRRAGVRTLVSYWGAPMSAINRGAKLLAKRLQVMLTPAKPDHFIFESEAMRATAVHGRGIPRHRTSVCYLGVDVKRFRPAVAGDNYAHRVFDIPRERKIVYYSGHFAPRKGVAVILNAIRELVEIRGRRDIHLLLLGNRAGEIDAYLPLIRGTASAQHVTFGGYRNDIDRITPSCHMATIASTGWDSFTMSALETAACGLPLVASRLQGLVETVEDGMTGYLFPAGDHGALADRLEMLLDDSRLHHQMSVASRERIVRRFSRDRQIRCLTDTIQLAWERTGLR